MKKYIIAVSGGPDSMALLHKYKRKVKAVCHVNYHDREDTDNDEMLLRKYCEANNLTLFVFDTYKDDISKYQSEKNLQTFYRKIRYDFFVKIANQLNVNKCLIGHHKDDFVESAKMAQLKNKTPLYLGIKRKSKYQDLYLYRPLLHKWKKELQDYCDKKEIAYAIDYSNFSDKYQRNVIRKQMHEMGLKEKQKFYKSIKKLNNKNLLKRIYTNYCFKQWEEKNFECAYIKNKSNKNRFNLWYLYLSLHNVKINHNKIKNIDDFVNSYNGNNKKYRILENKYLLVKNKSIVLEG